MLYVGGSSILEVWEGPGTVTFRGVFREGSKVLPWEALFFQIFVIFGYPGDPEGLNFLLKMHFLEALQFHDFGVRFGGGPAAGGGPWES